jgi:hypothetical protein
MTSARFDPHLQQAQGNFDLAATLDVSAGVQPQWACTLFFYAALHCRGDGAGAARSTSSSDWQP